jgi:hypothetical protein
MGVLIVKCPTTGKSLSVVVSHDVAAGKGSARRGDGKRRGKSAMTDHHENESPRPLAMGGFRPRMLAEG